MIINLDFLISDLPNPLYEYVKGLGYYKLHVDPKTWIEAKTVCEKEGAHLAIINSEEEAKLLTALRNRLPNLFGDWRDDVLYVGVNEIVGTWVTIFGKRY